MSEPATLPLRPLDMSTPASESSNPDHGPSVILIVSSAAVGTLLLIIGTILFCICMRRRRTSRRIGQLQEYLPTFMDEKSTEEYFKNEASTMVVSPPINIHHRTRSAPIIALEKAPITQTTNLVDSDYETALNKSLSTGSRARSLTVTIPSPTLHRGVSLNNHGATGYISRSPPIEEENGQDVSDVIPLPTVNNRPKDSKGHNILNRLSSGFSSHLCRRSSSSAMEFDPSLFRNAANSADTKKHSTRFEVETSDDDSDEDTVSTASSDSFDQLPGNQHHYNFETHDPYIYNSESRDINATHDIISIMPDPQYIQYRDNFTVPPTGLPSRNWVEGIAFRENNPALPSRTMNYRVHGRQELIPPSSNPETNDD
ncbi:hypothetical protein BGZ76_000184 [Entomortierella beljakovae]|nr:hypothetical protein BGZ76_000184 [Entomortierella beljakovae]